MGTQVVEQALRERGNVLVQEVAQALREAGHQVECQEPECGWNPATITQVNGQTVMAKAVLERQGSSRYSVRLYYTGKLRFTYWDVEARSVSLPEPKNGFQVTVLVERLLAAAKLGRARREAQERREGRLLYHRRLATELATEFELATQTGVTVEGTVDGLTVSLRGLEPEAAQTLLQSLREVGMSPKKGGS